MYKEKNSKKSFSLIELMVVIALLSILSYSFIPKNETPNISDVTNRLVLYLKQTRLLALTNNHYSLDESLWHKKRWTLKFFRCRNSVGGLYYSIYSDKNMTGHPSSEDSLKDPLTKRNIYSSNYCQENDSNSKYVLLTKVFDITDIHVSCNTTSSLGQLSFGSNGKIYTQLSPYDNESKRYELKERCEIKLSNSKNEKSIITIEPNTGFIYKK